MNIVTSFDMKYQMCLRYVIYIQAGIYNEIVRVPKEKTNLMFLGDGIGLTVITGNMDTSVMGMTTWLSATVGESNSL